MLVTEEATAEEVDAFLKSEAEELVSPTPTTLGLQEDGQYFIYEWQTYDVLALAHAPFHDADYFYKGKRNRLSNTATLKLENFVGVIQFREQRFQVHSRKMTYEQVQQLVSYIDDKITQLSLTFNSNALANSKLVRQKDDDEFNRFIYLYQLLKSGKLMRAWQLVARNPYQHFESNVEVVDFAMAKQLTPDNLIDAFSGQTPFVKSSRSLPFAKKLKGFLPEKINEYEKVVSNDNNENQFVLFYLQQCMKLLTNYIKRFEQQAEKEKFINEAFVQELKDYRSQLARITKGRFFQGVGRLTVINRSSTILTKRAGYKQLYSYYLNMKSSPQQSIDAQDFVELFENKSIDKLYEYVALFYLDDYLKDLYGFLPQQQKLGTSRKNYSVILNETNDKVKLQYAKEGYPTTTLSFQHSYTRGKKTSYALTQSPDFSLVIEHHGKRKLYHFDTKFKMKVFDVAEEGLTEQRRYAKEEDLKTMHAYRDGIYGTVGAYVLYPGDAHSEKMIYRDEQHAVHGDNDNAGIGSVPLQIADDNAELRAFLRELIEFELKPTPSE